MLFIFSFSLNSLDDRDIFVNNLGFTDTHTFRLVPNF